MATITNLRKLILIRSAVEEMQQDICGENEPNEASQEFLEASPALLEYLDALIEVEELLPTD